MSDYTQRVPGGLHGGDHHGSDHKVRVHPKCDDFTALYNVPHPESGVLPPPLPQPQGPAQPRSLGDHSGRYLTTPELRGQRIIFHFFFLVRVYNLITIPSINMCSVALSVFSVFTFLKTGCQNANTSGCAGILFPVIRNKQ